MKAIDFKGKTDFFLIIIYIDTFIYKQNCKTVASELLAFFRGGGEHKKNNDHTGRYLQKVVDNL